MSSSEKNGKCCELGNEERYESSSDQQFYEQLNRKHYEMLERLAHLEAEAVNRKRKNI